jgi:hypothetical protein
MNAPYSDRQYWRNNWKGKMCDCGKPAIGRFGGPECADCRELRYRSAYFRNEVEEFGVGREVAAARQSRKRLEAA